MIFGFKKRSVDTSQLCFSGERIPTEAADKAAKGKRRLCHAVRSGKNFRNVPFPSISDLSEISNDLQNVKIWRISQQRPVNHKLRTLNAYLCGLNFHPD
jgi:hypothetical protein